MHAKHLLGRLSLIATLLSVPAHAEQTWHEVQSPHFHVITDGSEKDGLHVANEFEQMRFVFATLFHQKEFESGAPLTVIAVRNLDTFRALDPALYKAQGDRIAGEFHRGWEKQFALVRLDTFEGQNQAVVFHEYTHSVLHANFQWLPTWLDEGLAEFYGYTRFDGKKVFIGRPSERMKYHYYTVTFPVDFMLTVNNTAGFHTHESEDIFYMESWAMVDYLMFGPSMGSGQKLMEFIGKLEKQEPEVKAFTETFGPPKAFETALKTYTEQLAFPEGSLPIEGLPDPKTYTVTLLTPAQADYQLGSYAIGNHERKRGRELMESAVKLDPSLAGAHEELGYLDFEHGDTEAARTEWKQAIALDPKLPRSNYALAMSGKPLSAQGPAELYRTRLALQHVTELDPRFAPAYVELAEVEWRFNLTRQAYADARTAQKLEPWRAGYRLLTASLLARGHQPAAAAQEARYVAEHWSGPDHNEAVEFLNTLPAADRGTGPPLTLDTPEGSTVTQGTLQSIKCPAEGDDEVQNLQLHVERPGQSPLELTADERFRVGSSDTFWWGADHLNPCRNLEGRHVLVAYKPAKDHENVLTQLEFRDDLPPVTEAPSPAAGAVATSSSSPAPSTATH